MRMLVKVSVPCEAGNAAIRDGSLSATIQKAMAELKPEAAYFTALDGNRTALFFLDMKLNSDMPMIAERFFLGLNAKVDFYPAMNAQDVAAGLAALPK